MYDAHKPFGTIEKYKLILIPKQIPVGSGATVLLLRHFPVTVHI